jgi:hypothetical protein
VFNLVCELILKDSFEYSRAGCRFAFYKKNRGKEEMDLEDFVEPEVAVAAAVAAAIFSPRARNVMRKGLVYGMAGVLVAGDAVTSFAKSIGRGVQQATHEASAESQQAQERERVGAQAGEGGM